METPNLVGNLVGAYCPVLTMSPYAKIRLGELFKLKEKTYHEIKWLGRARRAIILEASGSIVAARKEKDTGGVIFVVDLATCCLLTVFLAKTKPGKKYLGLGGHKVVI